MQAGSGASCIAVARIACVKYGFASEDNDTCIVSKMMTHVLFQDDDTCIVSKRQPALGGGASRVVHLQVLVVARSLLFIL